MIGNAPFHQLFTHCTSAKGGSLPNCLNRNFLQTVKTANFCSWLLVFAPAKCGHFLLCLQGTKAVSFHFLRDLFTVMCQESQVVVFADCQKHSQFLLLTKQCTLEQQAKEKYWPLLYSIIRTIALEYLKTILLLVDQ